jgi:lysophospholipase L1-like esterase
MSTKLICLAFVCLIAIAGNSQNKIVVIGSSTAYGYGLTNPAEESWVNRLKAYYMNQQVLSTSNNVVNLAVAGTNCITGMPTGYVSPYSSSDFRQSDPAKNITAAILSVPKPTVVIVSYPTNGYDWIPLGEVMYYLRCIKKYADSANVRCFITTTQPRNTFGVLERAKLRQLRDSIMDSFGNFAIDFWTPLAMPDNSQNILYAADSVHPNAAGHELLFNKVIAKDIFGFASTAPLAVRDLNLEIKTANNQALLSWRPLSADATTYFNVEKSKDGRAFNNLATIKNNGHAVLSYTDNNRSDSGKIFYRIAQIDATGSVRYSKIVNTEITNKGFDIVGFNPQLKGFNFSFYISVGKISEIKISLYSSSGILIRKSYNQVNFGSNKIDLPVPLANGIYYLNISNENMHVTKKIIRS